jgi:PmbA protein
MVKEMIRKEIVQNVMEYAKKKGFTDSEIYYSGNKNFTVKIHEGKIDSYTISQGEGVSFRGIFNGKMGYSYSEKVDESSVELLVKEAINNSEIIDSDDEEKIFFGGKDYFDINSYNSCLESIKEEDKIKFALEMEKEAKSADDRITAVQYCVYGDGYGEMSISNSQGLSLKDRANNAYAYVSVIAKEGEDIKTGMAYRVTNDFYSLDPKEIAREAANEAVSMLGAKTLKSGEYPVIIKNTAVADLLEAFVDIFSAEVVQKNLSLLKGKLNTQIAVEGITLTDNPHMKEGFASASFDGEGYPTKGKNIIENGVLKTFLHNMKTAAIDGVDSTGNASRGSYKSSIGISPSNFYIQPGSATFEDMIGDTKRGVYIVELQGLHSGLNPVSGDFSLSSYGYLIENGKIDRPVNQITISGNFFQMIKEIENIGSDLRFGLPSGAYIGAPSLKIKSLAIAGE